MDLFELTPQTLAALLIGSGGDVVPAGPFAHLVSRHPDASVDAIPDGELPDTHRFSDAVAIVARPDSLLFVLERARPQIARSVYASASGSFVLTDLTQDGTCVISLPVPLEEVVTRIVREIGVVAEVATLEIDQELFTAAKVLARGGPIGLERAAAEPLTHFSATEALGFLDAATDGAAELLGEMRDSGLLEGSDDELGFSPSLDPWLDAIWSGEGLEVQHRELPADRLPEEGEGFTRLQFLGLQGGRALLSVSPEDPALIRLRRGDEGWLRELLEGLLG